MTDTEFLNTVESVMNAFGSRTLVGTDELLATAGGDRPLFARCLAFLRERDEVFVAPHTPAVFHRKNVVDAVMDAIRTSGPQPPAALSATLEVPVALVCEVLGWLEREGRIRSHHQAEGVSFGVA